MVKIKFGILVGVAIGVFSLFADVVTSWSGTAAPQGAVVSTAMTLPELKARIDAKTHYLESEMSGTAFDGGIAQSSDFWAASANADGSWTVQIQCVYKGDLRFVNLKIYEEDGAIKATQIEQNWCSGDKLAFAKFVTDAEVSHSGSWKPGPLHYFAKSLKITDMNDCEAAIGDVKYKTLNEAKKVAQAAAAGSPLKEVTLMRDKILWTSLYVQNFTLIIPQGVTFDLANDDTADYNDANAKIYVKGTLNVRENCHLTVGKNVLELYAGGQITGVGDNYGLFFVTNTKEIPVRATGDGNDTFTIDGDVFSNCNITFNVDRGVNLKVKGGVNPTVSGYTVVNSGEGSMTIEGSVSGMHTVSPEKDLDVGTIAFNQDYSVVSYGGLIKNTDSTRDRNGTCSQMNSLAMTADTTIGGYSFGLVKTKYASTVIDLGGKALTIDMIGGDSWKTRNFYLANATIKNGGELVLKRGDLVLFNAPTTMNSGVLRLKGDAVLNMNGQTLTLNDFANEGGKISSGGNLVLVGTFSGGGTVTNLRMNDNSTIRLCGAETLTVTDDFKANGRLNVDLSDYLALDQPILHLPSAAAAQEVVDNAILTGPSIRTGCSLVADGSSVKLSTTPKTLWWASWQGTFWENVGGTDKNGNHGIGRDESGAPQAILSGDTVVFDRAHYTVDGEHLATDYWHYDENLYIKNEIRPGTANDWDLKVLEGVTLKLGLRGGRNDGQNVISDFKIFIDRGSAIELGYWGNTHHYQGVIRDDARFGGEGDIVFGADMGPSLRMEGDVFVIGESGTPTVRLNGKELVLAGKAGGERTDIELAIAGPGKISAQNDGIHVTGTVDFGSDSTLDATAHLLNFDNAVTFGERLTVCLAAAPRGEDEVKIANVSDAVFSDTDVRVVVGGSPVPFFYELVKRQDGLYVRERIVRVTYGVSADEGYDFAGALVKVTMDPAIEDLPVSLTIRDSQGLVVSREEGEWGSAMTLGPGGAGQAVVMAGDENQMLDRNQTYSYELSVADQTMSGMFFVGNRWFAANAESGVSVVAGGAWEGAAPAVRDGRYVLDGEADFFIAADRADAELAHVDSKVVFGSGIDAETLAEVSVESAKGAITVVDEGDGTCVWKGLVGERWVTLTGADVTVDAEVTVRIEYDRASAASRMRYLVDGAVLASETDTDADGWFAASGAISGVSCVGKGLLARLDGVVDNPAIAMFDGTKYLSMEAAVAAWRSAGSPADKPVRLLTNVFFAPEPGVYRIARGGFEIYMINDMTILRQSGDEIEIGFPETVVGYGNGEFPVSIGGEWLGHAIPWKSRRNVQRALLERGADSPFTRWQAYVLGFSAAETETARSNVRSVQNPDPDLLTLDDGLGELAAKRTGVEVRRVLFKGDAPGGVSACATTEYDADGRLPVVRLSDMGGAARYYKIGYEFAEDRGQDGEEEGK